MGKSKPFWRMDQVLWGWLCHYRVDGFCRLSGDVESNTWLYHLGVWSVFPLSEVIRSLHGIPYIEVLEASVNKLEIHPEDMAEVMGVGEQLTLTVAA